MSTKVFLTDDHKIMREGLRMLLEKHPGFEVVGEAEDGLEVIKKVRKLRPEVVIMDLGMPNLNGIEATRKIINEMPKIKIVGFSMHADRRFIVEMLKAGASAYLLKDCASEELVVAIRAVLADRIYLSPSLADTVIKDYINNIPRDSLSVFSILTAREREVLQLIAEGKNTKYIASKLYISVKTVETYRQNIKDKLNLSSIAELTKYAVREGLTSLDK